ncbi:MAG TPA: flippase-like domain-containing protein [Firmicutes bacterium]|nr:flippase-like domain-containing protein [Bacillota bacterium]
MKLKKWNLVLIVLAIAIFLIWMSVSVGIDTVLSIIGQLKVSWMLGAVLCMVIYWGLEADALHAIAKKLCPGQKFSSSLRTSMIGQFFNCVTPFSSGGQPMQAYSMVRSGMPLSTATISLLIKFIVYQSVLTLYSVVTLIVYFSSFAQKIDNFIYLVLIGFLVNLAVVIGLFCLCFLSRFTQWIANRTINLLAKLRLLKHPEEKRKYIQAEVTKFHAGIQEMQKYKGAVGHTIVSTILQLTAFYLIPYCIYRALGQAGASVFEIISAQACVQMISSFVPSPGAVGGAEISSLAIFNMFFPQSFLEVSVLLWRLITFYAPILLGLFTMLCVRRKKIDACSI